MTKQLLLGLAVGTLLMAMLPGLASAKDVGKSACKNGGWMGLVRANNTAFADQGECVTYVANGGTPRPPERTLAIAWTNVDLSVGYDPAADRLIAKLVDTNPDGVPGAGDTVTTNAFPTDFTTTGTVALATVTTFTTGAYVELEVGQVTVWTAAGQAFRWTARNHRNGEYYREEDGTGPVFNRWIGLQDTDGSGDSVYMNGTSPSATGVAQQVYAGDVSGDDPWLDIRVDLGS